MATEKYIAVNRNLSLGTVATFQSKSGRKNSEHYNDPTPYEAHKNIRKEEQLEAARMRTISALVGALKQVADLAGFEIVGRVVLMDKDSGRIFR